MNPETKTCQNCKQNFIIEPDDFEFYEKIKVPAPTFCPECRMVRRFSWRNERSLYKRKCDAPGHNEEIISIYHKDSPFKVYDQKYWWSDEWDPMDYGRDYYFNKPFFEQFKELMEITPREDLSDKNSVNCNYCNYSGNNKDCYLLTGSSYNENTFYSTYAWYTKDSVDLYDLWKGELCYENINCENNYKTFFAYYADNCLNSILLYNCNNCNNCFFCVNSRNKSYFYLNQPITKNDFEEKTQNISSFRTLQGLLKEFQELKLKQPHRFARITYSYNCVGENIKNSKNCYFAFEIIGKGAEDCKFIFRAGDNLKDSYDSSQTGINSELIYEGVSVVRSSGIQFSYLCWDNMDVKYSANCHNSSNLFGCIGLRNKQYCILNKQYSKEEYEQLVPKIIEHMNNMLYTDQKGRIYKYGEFFPLELSPFAYNETIAQEYFPLTKEQAIEKGYKWKEPEQRNVQITISNSQLPDHIKDIPDSIINEIIECRHKGVCDEQCTQAFKIIKPELDFYRKMNLPLPRLCPNCRHYARLRQRNPLKLWKRKCQCAGQKSSNGVYENTIQHLHAAEPCPNEFQTTYAPERPEIVYCEKCYQQEII